MGERAISDRSFRQTRSLGGTLFRILLLGLPLIAVVVGGYLYVVGGRFVSTDNAYIKADIIAVSTDVSERVSEILVSENQLVEANQVLFRLNDEPFRIALRRAEAQMAEAIQHLRAIQAQRAQKTTELEIAVADVEFYRSAFERARDLRQRGITSEAKFDEAQRALDTARKQVIALRQEIAQVDVQLGGDAPPEQHPSVLALRAQRDHAALELQRTEIVAPARASVTNLRLQVGEYVEAGTPVFSLVRADGMWVQANLKETNLTYVREGQLAEIRVDTYPDRVWTGRVRGISSATGAEFSLLPPQNSSGNWVKVVQRLPVRIEIMGGPGDLPLRTGMSAVVDIDTGHKRVLPSFVNSAFAWVKGER
jgi:membrane fusion protein (multidrug efflux system)